MSLVMIFRRFWVCAVLVYSLCPVWVGSANPFYVAETGNDASNGLSWATAKRSVEAAVALAVNVDDTVIISNGTYTVTSAWIQVTNSITVRSVNGPLVTFLDAANVDGRRVMNVAHSGARVEGLTLMRGNMTSWVQGGALWLGAGTVSNCVIVGSKAYLSGGAYITNGLLVDCLIVSNTAHSSGGTGGGLYISGGEVRNCVISNNESYVSGSGIYITGGTVRDSKIVNNPQSGSSATYGGGVRMTGGLIERCMIRGNTLSPYGGGVYLSAGVLRNCLIANNTARNQGGGIYMAAGTGRVEQCTVSGNLAENQGKGIFMASGSGGVSNSIVYYNGVGYGSLDGNVHRGGGTVTYSCTQPVVDGLGNTGADPLFTDATKGDFSLFAGSPCIDTGATIGTVTNDLVRAVRPRDGNGDSVALHDMGAYESGDPGLLNFSCRFSAATNEAYLSLDAVLTATVAGANTNIIWYGWDFNNDGLFDAAGADRRVVTHTFSPGYYSIALSVSNTSLETASFTRTNYIRVAPATHYVSTNGTAVAPYVNWTTAATNIQAAINAAWSMPGVQPMVRVSNGTYLVGVQITIVTNMTVKSENGPQATIVDAGNVVGRRVFRVAANEAVLDGFTIKRGILRDFSSGGAGLRLEGGTVTNCYVTGCESWSLGGGVWMSGGLLTQCRVFQNSGTSAGATPVGGVYLQGGIIRDSVIVSNTTTANGPGAGINMTGGIVERTFIATNSAGGPTYTTSDGGGLRMSGGTATHSRVIGNTSYGRGGGVYQDGGLLRNCLVTGNSAPSAGFGGGGVYLNAAAARMESCTVAGNSSVGDGKGLFLAAGAVTNSVIYANSATPNVHQTGGSIRYSCMTPLVGDESNTAGDPFFVDANAGNYRLGSGSAAADKGTNLFWMETGFDLDGTNRVQNTIVDMGAFERAVVAGGPLECLFSADPYEGLLSLEADFAATVSGGNTNIVNYHWDFGDGNSESGANLNTVSHTYAPGYYTVTLTVLNDADDEAFYTRESYIRVIPETVYVGKGGSNTPPYLDSNHAASNLQAAVDLGSPKVVVGTGTYVVAAQVNVTRTLDLRGSEGAAKTIIDAANSGRALLVNATNAWVSGLTIRGGRLYNFSEGGAGLRLQAGTVSNCVITANSGYIYGAGAWVTGGLLVDCDVRQNLAVATASNGGGLYLGGGTVARCRIVDNSSSQHGGGACVVGGLLTHSQVISNYVYSAASASGGGLYLTSGAARNCLVVRNGSAQTINGGGIWMSGGLVESCTVASNRAAAIGGGVLRSGGGVTNTLVCLNTAPSGADISGVDGFGYCASPDLTQGVNGNISAPAIFVDADAGNYFLQNGSPGGNAGLWQDWMRDALDLSGNRRIVGGVPDMGAYETEAIRGSVFTIR